MYRFLQKFSRLMKRYRSARSVAYTATQNSSTVFVMYAGSMGSGDCGEEDGRSTIARHCEAGRKRRGAGHRAGDNGGAAQPTMLTTTQSVYRPWNQRECAILYHWTWPCSDSLYSYRPWMPSSMYSWARSSLSGHRRPQPARKRGPARNVSAAATCVGSRGRGPTTTRVRGGRRRRRWR